LPVLSAACACPPAWLHLLRASATLYANTIKHRRGFDHECA
jgi:hypothetical protein